jgi:U5 small nuclear ribonucleoprotein component
VYGKVQAEPVFDKWEVVSGDSLDREAKPRPLEMASLQAAARDFVLKARRRKGLAEGVTLSKFLEPEMWKGLEGSSVLDT